MMAFQAHAQLQMALLSATICGQSGEGDGTFGLLVAFLWPQVPRALLETISRRPPKASERLVRRLVASRDTRIAWASDLRASEGSEIRTVGKVLSTEYAIPRHDRPAI